MNDEDFSSHPIVKQIRRQRADGGGNYIILGKEEVILPDIVMAECRLITGQRVGIRTANHAARATLRLIAATDDLSKITAHEKAPPSAAPKHNWPMAFAVLAMAVALLAGSDLIDMIYTGVTQ